MTDEYSPPTPEAIAFLTELFEETGRGPFEGVYVRCQYRTGSVIELRNIGTEGERGRGKGSIALSALLDLADRTGADILVQPEGNEEAQTARLDAWYRRLGFSECGEANRLLYQAGSRPVPSP